MYYEIVYVGIKYDWVGIVEQLWTLRYRTKSHNLLGAVIQVSTTDASYLCLLPTVSDILIVLQGLLCYLAAI